MKYVKLFEEFVSEARSSQEKSLLQDYWNANYEFTMANDVVNLEQDSLEIYKVIKNPIDANSIQGRIDDVKSNTKKQRAISNKWAKKISQLEKEAEKYDITSQQMELTKNAATLQGQWGGLPFFREEYEEFASQFLSKDRKDLDAINKIVDAYHKEYDKKHEEASKVNDDWDKMIDSMD